MDISLILPAFIAGLLTFLAPCTLPLVPGYLGFISGVSLTDLDDLSKRAYSKKKIILNGLLFMLGFTVVFMALGSIFGLGGMLLSRYREVFAKVGGVLVVIFGLYMMGLLDIAWFAKQKRIPVHLVFKPGSPLNAFLFGITFALGWTPCVGPVLGSALTLAAASATALQGGVLLLVFSLGLALPFLFIALAAGHASAYIHRINPYLHGISVVGGIFLVFLGVLIFTDNLAVWVGFFYKLFSFFNYDGLLKYL